MKKLFLVSLSLIMLLSGCAQQKTNEINVVIPNEIRVMEYSENDLIIQELANQGIVFLSGYTFYPTDKFDTIRGFKINGEYKTIYLSSEDLKNPANFHNDIILSEDGIVNCDYTYDDVCKVLEDMYGDEFFSFKAYAISPSVDFSYALLITKANGESVTVFAPLRPDVNNMDFKMSIDRNAILGF